MGRHGAVVAQGPFKPRVAGSNPAGGSSNRLSGNVGQGLARASHVSVWDSLAGPTASGIEAVRRLALESLAAGPGATIMHDAEWRQCPQAANTCSEEDVDVFETRGEGKSVLGGLPLVTCINLRGKHIQAGGSPRSAHNFDGSRSPCGPSPAPSAVEQSACGAEPAQGTWDPPSERPRQRPNSAMAPIVALVALPGDQGAAPLSRRRNALLPTFPSASRSCRGLSSYEGLTAGPEFAPGRWGLGHPSLPQRPQRR